MDLFEAIGLNRIAEVRRCIEAGADPNAPGPKGTLPVMAALETSIHFGNEGIPRLLCEAGADTRLLMRTLTERLRQGPASLLRYHNDTARDINGVLDAFKDIIRDLSPDELERLQAFIAEAEEFDGLSKALRERAAELDDALSNPDPTAAAPDTIDQAVEHLAQTFRFEMKAAALQMRAIALRSLLD
ncbi:MAG: hypothetical protein ABL934_04640 [Lysobacteraceae bacterium]